MRQQASLPWSSSNLERTDSSLPLEMASWGLLGLAFPDHIQSHHRGVTRLAETKEGCSTQFLNKFIIS